MKALTIYLLYDKNIYQAPFISIMNLFGGKQMLLWRYIGESFYLLSQLVWVQE